MSELTPFAQKNDNGEIQGRYKVLFFTLKKISNATVTSKQNFIEKYYNNEHENIRKNPFHSILLDFEYYGTFYRLENPKTNNSREYVGGRARLFFSKKISGGVFIRDLRVAP